VSAQVSPERLFDLLPSVYRVRDAGRGEPLRALLTIAGEQFEELEADIERVYDNWFIETCDEWVVPYIGDLLSVRGLISTGEGVFSQRAFVANTLAYRRGKGTKSVLEQLARDATGWPSKAVEFFELLATTRYMNHERARDVSTVEVRDPRRAELVGTPLDGEAHTADVRHVDIGRGKFNIANLGLYLWRLHSYYTGATPVPDDPTEPPPASGAAARDVTPSGGTFGRFTFSPLGLNTPLFNVPRAETALTQLAAEANVPGALRRRPLHDELEALRQALVDDLDAPRVYFDERQPVFELDLIDTAGAAPRPVPAEEVVICHLGEPGTPVAQGWHAPPSDKKYVKTGTTTEVARKISAGVDPVSGRIAFPDGVRPASVRVTFAYGFPGDLGGGPYSRRESLEDTTAGLAPWRVGTVSTTAAADPALGIPPSARGLVSVLPGANGSAAGRPRVLWQVGVAEDAPQSEPAYRRTLTDAVADWNSMPAGTAGVIALMDSRSYPPNLKINVPAGSRLAIVAADWPRDDLGDESGPGPLTPGRLTPDERRPHLGGLIEVEGTAPANRAPGEVLLDGLLIEGGVRVLPGNLGSLAIAHSTLVPAAAKLEVQAGNAASKANGDLAVALRRSVSGPVQVAGGVGGGVRVRDSIVDAGGGLGVQAGRTRIEGSTVFGDVDVVTLNASNSILRGSVEVVRRQTGCARFCWLPLESAVPRRFRCVPTEDDPDLAPAFSADAYGDPAYGQLASACPLEIREGGDDEGEIGAFNFLKQAQRLSNLTTRLDEYLPFGLEAGVFFVT
jgi:hypothetical protein